MLLRFSVGFLLLLLALALQFSFASWGIFTNLSFATLIAFAFIFDFFELLALVLVGVFIVNWQPAASLEIAIFAVFPLAAYFLRSVVHWQSWFMTPIAIIVGFLVLYAFAAPREIFMNTGDFLADLAGGLVFGVFAFFPLARRWK